MKHFSLRRVRKHTLLALRNIWQEFSSVAKVTTHHFSADLSSQDRARIEKLVTSIVQGKHNGWHDMHDVVLLANWYTHLEDSGRGRFLLTIAHMFDYEPTDLFDFLSCFVDIPEGMQLLLHIYEDTLKLHDDKEKKYILAALDRILSLVFNMTSASIDIIDFSSSALLLERISTFQSPYPIKSWVNLKNKFNLHHVYLGIYYPLLGDPALVIKSKLTDGYSVCDLNNADEDPDVGKCHSMLFYDVLLLEPGLNACVVHRSMKQIIAHAINLYPHVKHYRATTPLHGFTKWLSEIDTDIVNSVINIGLQDELTKNIAQLLDSELNDIIDLHHDLKEQSLTEIIQAFLVINKWHEHDQISNLLYPYIIRFASYYILRNYNHLDPDVGNNRGFHLCNGASIEEIQWLANTSNSNLQESAGMMVVYSYQISEMDNNSKKYIQGKAITASTGISKWLEI